MPVEIQYIDQTGGQIVYFRCVCDFCSQRFDTDGKKTSTNNNFGWVSIVVSMSLESFMEAIKMELEHGGSMVGNKLEVGLADHTITNYGSGLGLLHRKYGFACPTCIGEFTAKK